MSGQGPRPAAAEAVRSSEMGARARLAAGQTSDPLMARWAFSEVHNDAELAAHCMPDAAPSA